MDIDGDGRADLVCWRPSTGVWSVLYSSTGYGAGNVIQWGLEGDFPIRADFDGDRRGDLVIWHPGNGTWYVRYSSSGFSYVTAAPFQWGQAGDDPI